MTHRSRLSGHLIYSFLVVSVLFIFMYARGTASEQPIKKRVAELEEKIKGLQEENDNLAYEVAQLRRAVEKSAAKGNTVRSKRTAISKVKRISRGRPQNKDMMVGVTQLISVWDQMDFILDKLDEVTVQISQ